MKQYLLLLAGLMILAPYSQADAKAVKLGRGNAYSVATDTNLNTGAGSAKVDTEKNATVPVQDAIQQQENVSAVRREKDLMAADV